MKMNSNTTICQVSKRIDYLERRIETMTTRVVDLGVNCEQRTSWLRLKKIQTELNNSRHEKTSDHVKKYLSVHCTSLHVGYELAIHTRMVSRWGNNQFSNHHPTFKQNER